MNQPTGTSVDDAAPVVIVSSRSFPGEAIEAVEALERAGFRVVRADTTHDLDAMADHLGQAQAWIAGTQPVTDAHLERAPNLRIVARYGVGVDAVDLDAASRSGVMVTNTPGANSGAVADHAVGLMLAALRGSAATDAAVRRGDWSPRRGRELGSRSVAVVGAGRIGREVLQRLSGFGSEAWGVDPFLTSEQLQAAGFKATTFDELPQLCDLVSLHSPGDAPLVTEAWLAGVRPGTVLVNTARAVLVNEEAVAAALRDGRLSFYAADTLADETGASSSLLLADDLRERTLFTPHIAAQTSEAVAQMSLMASQSVIDHAQGRRPASVVSE